MDAMDRVIASMSPEDAAAALRLLKLLEECGQMKPVEAADWMLRIAGWAWFNAVEAEAAASA
jgi:hypothetical protein